MKKIKLIRSANVSGSLDTFCKGMLRKMSMEYEVIALATPDDVLEQVGKREGVRTAGIRIERRPSILKDIKSLWDLIVFFRKEKPTIVHSMSAKCGLLCMIAAKLTGVPHRVHSFTGLAFPTAKGINRLILMTTERITCLCANHLLPEGEGVKNDLINSRITKKELRIIGNGNIRGVDMEYYSRNKNVSANASSLRKDDNFTFVFVGRIVRDKGINELCVATEQLHKEFENVRLILIGDRDSGVDPISDESNRIIDESDFIEDVGKQNDVRPFLVASDCFVFPSYREGFPNSVLEAGAMGLPCIVTDINGANEIIIEGKNGVIIPSHDSGALYDAMKLMICNDEKRNMMAKNARKMVADRYEINFVQNAYLDFYKEIISKND